MLMNNDLENIRTNADII